MVVVENVRQKPGKPAKSAFEYLQRCQRDCAKKFLQAKAALALLGINDHVLIERLETYSMRNLFADNIKTASWNWGDRDVFEALKKLDCVRSFPITEEVLMEVAEKLAEK